MEEKAKINRTDIACNCCNGSNRRAFDWVVLDTENAEMKTELKASLLLAEKRCSSEQFTM